jgi:RNA polymerase sigma factor (sigma-70 family)
MSAVADRRPINVGGLSDEELVRLARSGFEPAFDAIVHRYQAPLHSYCRRWLDAHRAEEVVQHTLMKAFVCVRDDPRPLVLRPWLYRVAHNAALNAVEKKGADWEQLDENYDGVPQPPQVAEQRARFAKVVCDIGALPARQRDALLLNEFEGRCYADIAAQLGTSESGVRGLLRRARRQLRETTAALLLPFPVLRELVRTEGGRGLQIERTGELIGTASVAGGAGAAGGFAKVAAGVLAAGTIASGGTAIERSDDPVRVPDAKAAGVAVVQSESVPPAGGALGTTPAPELSAPFALSRIAAGGAQLFAGAGLTPSGENIAAWLDRMEYVPREIWDPSLADPEPALPVAPELPVETAPEQAPAEEEPAADETQDGAASEGETVEPEADEPAPDEQEQPPPDEHTAGSEPDAVTAAPSLGP